MSDIFAWHRFLAGRRIRLVRALDGPGRRAALVGRLVDDLAEDQGSGALRLGHDALGRPLLLDPQGREAAVRLSFTRFSGSLWAAAGRSLSLGVDAAAAAEFGPDYPVHRAFALEERQEAAEFCAGEAEVLALLWSLKEAAAKALGAGFNGVEPKELTATAFCGGPEYLTCTVRGPRNALPALAERVPGGWLALAVQAGTQGAGK